MMIMMMTAAATRIPDVLLMRYLTTMYQLHMQSSIWEERVSWMIILESMGRKNVHLLLAYFCARGADWNVETCV